MAQPRLFSLEEANALVPTLTEIVGTQLKRQFEIDSRLRNLAQLMGRMPRSLEPMQTDPPDVRGLKYELTEQLRALDEGWEPISSLGAVVKDSRTGLIGFYGVVEGRMVCLCWQYGEHQIASFHELDDGFSGRKRILPSTQHHLLN